jgi:predicted  nucleic acid-binding Zn-ribbon protein
MRKVIGLLQPGAYVYLNINGIYGNMSILVNITKEGDFMIVKITEKNYEVIVL